MAKTSTCFFPTRYRMKWYLTSMCFTKASFFVFSVRLIDPRLSSRNVIGFVMGIRISFMKPFIHIACLLGNSMGFVGWRGSWVRVGAGTGVGCEL
ncbi:hypothetical protein BDZ89DRAFT_1203464, partial [Hymenopellis radicata]